jgi:CubicO group peptidase (beta-lactamase class C family)
MQTEKVLIHSSQIGVFGVVPGWGGMAIFHPATMGVMMRIMRRSVVVLLILWSLASVAQTTEKAGAIDKVLSAYAANGDFNGSALVTWQGKVIVEKGYGMANFEWKIPNGPDTKFRLGSITKQFTSMLVMQQVAEGKIKLDGKLSEYLPYYRKDTGERVTIHHLLTHTSGIPSYTERADFPEFRQKTFTPEEFVKKFCSGDLQFEPGSKFHYDNSGYFLLGAILEKVTGKSYEELLQERIFGPLGMNDSGYDHSNAVLDHRAGAYQRRPEGLMQNAAYLDMSVPYAAGSLYSTIEDLYKWDQALYTDKLLAPDLKEKMFTPYKDKYAFGWFVETAAAGKPGAGGPEIAHEGGINGFHTIIDRYPREKVLIVLLDNASDGPLEEMSNQVARVLYDMPTEKIRASITTVVGPLALKSGGVAAAAKYHELRKSEDDDYRWDEAGINILGYHLMNIGRVKDGIEILKLNIEAFPKSANAYDSLGEAYMKDGQKELAIANYKKSVEIDPKSESGIEALKKLEGK